MRFIITILLSLFVGQAVAQVRLQVASRSITRTFEYKEGYLIDIEGEKAKIHVNTWDKDEMKVTMRLVAKHPNKDTAAMDLRQISFVMEQRGDTLVVLNKMNHHKDGREPNSGLRAIYEVVVPVYCPVNLENHFGNADISSLESDVEIQSEYCQIKLTDVRGRVNVKSYYGNIEAQYVSGEMFIDSYRSNINLKDLSGVFDIKAKYAMVNIDANPSLVRLDIVAEKSDVFFNTPKVESFSYDLLASHGRVNVPNKRKFDWLNFDSHERAYLNQANAAVNITTTFGKIVIGNNAF